MVYHLPEELIVEPIEEESTEGEVAKEPVQSFSLINVAERRQG